MYDSSTHYNGCKINNYNGTPATARPQMSVSSSFEETDREFLQYQQHENKPQYPQMLFVPEHPNNNFLRYQRIY